MKSLQFVWVVVFALFVLASARGRNGGSTPKAPEQLLDGHDPLQDHPMLFGPFTPGVDDGMGRELQSFGDEDINIEHVFNLTTSDVVYHLAVTPDNSKVVGGTEEGVIKVWSLTTGLQELTFGGNEGNINSLVVTPDNSKVISSHYGRILIWSLTTGQLEQTLEEDVLEEPMNEAPNLEDGEFVGYIVALTPDGSTLVSVDGGTIAVWSLSLGTVQQRVPTTALYWSVAISPDGSKVVLGDIEGSIIVYSLQSSGLSLERTLLGAHLDAISNILVTPDGSKIVTVGEDSFVKVWLNTTLSLEHTLGDGESSPVVGVVVTADSKRLISVGYDDIIKTWSLTTGSLIQEIFTNHLTGFDALAMTSDDDKIVTSAYDLTTTVWQITNLSKQAPASQFTSSPAFQTTSSPTIQPAISPPIQPTFSTIQPSLSPTIQPTWAPFVYQFTWSPAIQYFTWSPTIQPTSSPTSQPTVSPTIQPTVSPTIQPTVSPTIQPTSSPTIKPTPSPTVRPTSSPTVPPTSSPTVPPTSSPTIPPTSDPTSPPTSFPTFPPVSSPDNQPDQDAFIVQYAGSTQAGFGDNFQGNEIIVPFIVSTQYSKEISLLYNNCTTALPANIMVATAHAEPSAGNRNLGNYNVSLALNIAALTDLKNGPDSPLWKGADSNSSVLTFCVRVDLMSNEDLVSGDEVVGSRNRTSVNFETVSLEVEIDFTFTTITGVVVASKVPELEFVDASLYGVTGCHCDAAKNCYDRVSNLAPLLTLDDTLDVCFNASAAGVSIVDVTAFTITQGVLSFDTLLASSTDFYSESFQGNSAVFRSRLVSAFFDDVTLTLGVMATLELSFSRRLSHMGIATSTGDVVGGGKLNHRRLQEEGALVVVEVDALTVSLGVEDVGGEGSIDDDSDSSILDHGHIMILVVCLCLGVVAFVLLSAFVLRHGGNERGDVALQETKKSALSLSSSLPDAFEVEES